MKLWVTQFLFDKLIISLKAFGLYLIAIKFDCIKAQKNIFNVLVVVLKRNHFDALLIGLCPDFFVKTLQVD